MDPNMNVITHSKIKCHPRVSFGWLCPRCKTINFDVKSNKGVVTCLYMGCRAQYNPNDFEVDKKKLTTARKIMSNQPFLTESGILIQNSPTGLVK